MRVQINEVWNREGKTIELVQIDTTPAFARQDVVTWIHTHRPDLMLAQGLDDHGYHAVSISQNIQAVPTASHKE